MEDEPRTEKFEGKNRQEERENWKNQRKSRYGEDQEDLQQDKSKRIVNRSARERELEEDERTVKFMAINREERELKNQESGCSGNRQDQEDSKKTGETEEIEPEVSRKRNL